ncbi:MAG: ribonuclease P protein component [Polyangiaceae bacterium]|nr:ribonuclease P protein component [Polyangiaceae bacterium]
MAGLQPAGRFRRNQRIRRRVEYRNVHASAQRVVTSHFVFLLLARASAPGHQARLGISVSRRQGNAVARNRAKRLIREAFRATRPLWAADIDVVVLVRRPLGSVDLGAVVREWQSATLRLQQRTQSARADRESRLANAP